MPQIISPLIFDQPDNAERVALLGVGARLEREQLTGASVAHMARRVLEDVAVGAALRAVRERIRASDALTSAAELIQRSLRGQTRRVNGALAR